MKTIMYLILIKIYQSHFKVEDHANENPLKNSEKNSIYWLRAKCI